jgi:hypothetical protein
MTKLTETQGLILSAAAQRRGNLALPLPKVLVGAAARMAVGKMIKLGWLEEVEVNLRRGDPLWRETGDGKGNTLIATDAGLLAIGIEPVVVQTMAVLRERAKTEPLLEPNQRKPRAGTKQAMLIEMLRRPEGATLDEITASTEWQTHTVRGAMSGALGKKLGLVITSEKDDVRGRVYRIAPSA